MKDRSDREGLPETEVAGGSGAARTPAAEVLPETIGPYRILERLGAGGMGIVYLAEQTEPIRRRVAVKVLSPFREDAVHQARFDREIAALATMEHPFIARVLDAGSEEGRPYYVMEVVDGPPITYYAEAEGLSVRQRLELFLQICEGVHHAHQRGVIHRDIKPGNVLVSCREGEEPRPRVIDFGLARQTGVASDLSVTGSVVGTPKYMSPEQLQGLDSAIDTRTDVYALGILLYELLVGRNPYGDEAASSLLTLARRVLEDEPPVPSQEVSRSGWSGVDASGDEREATLWSRRLEGDLDWILLKAMAKEPERRYASVSEFAADIQRHLRHEPVQAGPPTRRYRARKFVRRHRAAVLVGSLAVLLLALTAFGATLAWRRSVVSEGEARKAQAEAVAAAEEAEAIRAFLEEILASVDPSRAGRDVRLLSLLDAQSASIEHSFVGQPAVEASVRHILGRTYGALGAYHRASEHLDRAVEVRRELLGRAAPDTLQTRYELARLALLEGDLEAAETQIDEVLADQRRVLGESAMTTEESEYLRALIAYRRGRSDEAFELFQALRTRMADRGESGAQLALQAKQEMAGVLVRRGEHEAAEGLYREVLDENRRRFGDDHPATLRSENRLGNALYRQRRWVEAEAIYQSVADRSAEVLGPEHPSTLLALNNVANVLDKQERYEPAEAIFRQALATARRVVGERHPDTLLLLNNLGNVLRHDGRLREAESTYRLARAYQVEVLGPAHPETLRTVSNLVKVFWGLDQPHEADRLTAEVLAQVPESAQAWGLRVEVLDRAGRSAEAAEAQRRLELLTEED